MKLSNTVLSFNELMEELTSADPEAVRKDYTMLRRMTETLSNQIRSLNANGARLSLSFRKPSHDLEGDRRVVAQLETSVPFQKENMFFCFSLLEPNRGKGFNSEILFHVFSNTDFERQVFSHVFNSSSIYYSIHDPDDIETWMVKQFGQASNDSAETSANVYLTYHLNVLLDYIATLKNRPVIENFQRFDVRMPGSDLD